jgi:diguanylate cyclase (GGDEF)-like protein/PAS domain S-box-containing protein
MTKNPIHLETPGRMVAALLLVVAAAEIAVMVTLHNLFHFDELTWWVVVLFDAGALTLLVSLFVVFAVIRPLKRALRHEQEKARTVLDSASEGIITIDAFGTIRAFNRAAEQLFGFVTAEAVGHNISLIVPNPDKELHDTYLRRYRDTGHGRVVNARCLVQAQRPDGSVFPVEMSISEADVLNERLFTAIIHDITERRRMEDRIHYLAYHDALTRLPNRALYFDRLAQALTLAHREHRKVGLLLLDLDGFKPINDRYGHEAGDEVLRQIAIRLQGLVRDSDTVARLGGDEFMIILLSIVDRASAEDLARRAGAIVDEPYALAAGSVSVGVSVGIAVYPDDGLSADELTRFADGRMYETKTGRKLVELR